MSSLSELFLIVSAEFIKKLCIHPLRSGFPKKTMFGVCVGVGVGEHCDCIHKQNDDGAEDRDEKCHQRNIEWKTMRTRRTGDCKWYYRHFWEIKFRKQCNDASILCRCCECGFCIVHPLDDDFPTTSSRRTESSGSEFLFAHCTRGANTNVYVSTCKMEFIAPHFTTAKAAKNKNAISV